MDIELKTWLYDILKAVDEINSFLGEDAGFPGYQKDLRTKRAVERNLEIIGEAMSRIVKKDISVKLSSSRKIIDTRNRIIHGYDTVSDEIIWGIVVNHLPRLKHEVGQLLNS